MTPATLDDVRQAIENSDTGTLLKQGRFLRPAIDRLYGENTSPAARTQISRALNPVYEARITAAPRCPAEKGTVTFSAEKMALENPSKWH